MCFGWAEELLGRSIQLVYELKFGVGGKVCNSQGKTKPNEGRSHNASNIG